MRWAGHMQRRDMRYSERGAGDELPGRKKPKSRKYVVREDAADSGKWKGLF